METGNEDIDLGLDFAPITFWVAGLPKGEPRARAAPNHKGVYTPNTADDWKALVRQAAEPVMPKPYPDAAVAVTIDLFMPRPKHHWTKQGTLKPHARKWARVKPDNDNAEKLIYDVLKKIGCYNDDCDIVVNATTKQYGDPGALVTVKYLFE